MQIKNKNEVKERLLSFIDDNLNEYECWEYRGALSNGYGRISINNQAQSAHRVSYAIFIGEFNTDLYVCHKCDNRCCINPKHLFLGTHSDNIKDSYDKGRTIVPEGDRFKKGHMPKNAEMSLEKAKKVKDHIMDENRSVSLKKLAKIYDIKYQTVRDISAGRSYINI